MCPRFDRLEDSTGVEVLEPTENHRYTFHTPEEVSLRPGDTELFALSTTVARRITTSSVTLSYNVPVAVRDASDGSHLFDVGHDGTYDVEADDYLLEVSAPVKLYLRVSSAFTIEATTEYIRFEFGDETTVELGAKSNSASPEATITVPADPEAAMEAVSTFGSALKTTTCERSWPVPRNHPPRIERGDELAIPDEIDAPDTGVTLHVPADYEHVCTVASLAYYLGADVVPDETPRLTAENGFVHRLDTERGFEDEVNRVLKQVFLLDCSTRTEGRNPMDVAECRAVESVTDLDFTDLYGAPLGDQLETYLSISYSTLADAIPEWSRVTHVRPVADSVELLPFVANDLSLIRVESSVADSSPATDERRDRESDAVSSFKRWAGLDDDGLDLPTDPEPRATGVPDSSEYVPLPETDAMERAWVGDGTPVHGTKLHPSAFAHEQSESSDGVIDVTVVCNDGQMREEWDAVSTVYGTRDVVSFDVDCRFDVSTDELRSLLAESHDLFHFVGHIDGRGFACRDGVLNAETLSSIGATTVLLNACRSHDQGVALVEAGARAAIVSWGDVDNLGAVEVGETFARLLNYGFGVGGALEVVEEHTTIGRHYVVVGDPSATIAQCADGNPLVYELESDSATVPGPDEEVSATVRSYATEEYPIGAAAQPHLQGDADPDYYLVPGRMKTFTNSGAEFREALADYSAPIVVDGELRWTDEWYAENDAAE